MSVNIRLSLNKGIYLKDPQDSALGQKIIKHSILLIDEIGFEAFTFKKLAKRMQSTEASVYRYFENKHAVLIYLVCWYWQWVIYLIKINTLNIKDPKQKLKIIIHSFVAASVENPSVDYVDENKLHNVLIAEGKKAYHTKAVDKENKKQFFQDYKQLIAIVADVISELDPKFEYPHSLATSLFEMANDHIYFAQHLPRLTDIKVADNKYTEVEQMLNYFAAKLLGYKL